MDEPLRPSDPLATPVYSSDCGSDEVEEHRLALINPDGLDLPTGKWAFCRLVDGSLVIYEVTMPLDSSTLRIRKHVHVDLLSGVCTSYVLDRKISEMVANTVTDVERCVEELHMIHVCSGGPAVSRLSPEVCANARVDAYGNWRHDSCRIFVGWTGLSCSVCESLENELAEIERANKRKERKADEPKSITVANLSHRKQRQIILLRKRRQSWYRKKINAEKEMKLIDDMIAEVAEEPKRVEDDNEDNDEDDDEL